MSRIAHLCRYWPIITGLAAVSIIIAAFTINHNPDIYRLALVAFIALAGINVFMLAVHAEMGGDPDCPPHEAVEVGGLVIAVATLCGALGFILAAVWP